MAGYVLRHFGVRAMIGFVRLMAFCSYPASLMDRFTPRSVPPTLDELLATAPTARKRRQTALAFTGSAMDLVDRFLPDRQKHRTLRALVAFAAVQSTYKGPFTPGSALCLVYTFAQNEGGGLMRRVKGGMGMLSEALRRSIADKGGEVRTKTAVRSILVETAVLWASSCVTARGTRRARCCRTSTSRRRCSSSSGAVTWTPTRSVASRASSSAAPTCTCCSS
jgi:phytoene dehydrogenase-like protein